MAASSSRANEGEIVETGVSGRFSRYDIIIGEGTSKTVYKGFDAHFGTEIAWSKIKLSSGKKNLKELCEEPILLTSLNHPNITKCHQYWNSEDKTVVNMITEFCHSGNLFMYCNNHVQNLLSNTAIKNWCRQILNALHYLHTRDPPVTHRDIKCGNIFVKGNTSTVKLGDFGMAKEYPWGSKPVYSTDIYSFGLALTQMVSPQMQFSECSSDRDLVQMGFKSVGVLGITDPQIKDLLFKCITSNPYGSTAMDLLNDPFLAVGVVDRPTASGSDDGFRELRDTVKDEVAKLLLPLKEDVMIFNIDGMNMRLQGKFTEHNSKSVSLKLIFDGNYKVTTIEFDLILGADDIPDIMDGFNEECQIFFDDEVKLVSEIIRMLVTELQDEPHDSNTPSIAEEDWRLQDLFLEESSSNNTSNDGQGQASSPSNSGQQNREMSNEGQASNPSNSGQQNQETSNDGQGQAKTLSNSSQQDQETSNDGQGQASSPSKRSQQDQEMSNDGQGQANTTTNSSQQNQQTSNDAQGEASSPSNRSQHNQATEQQQMQRGRSDDNNRRRGHRKLSSWIFCKHF